MRNKSFAGKSLNHRQERRFSVTAPLQFKKMLLHRIVWSCCAIALATTPDGTRTKEQKGGHARKGLAPSRKAGGIACR